MSPETTSHGHHHEDALDHLEEEIKALEGVSRWRKPLWIIGWVIFLGAIVGGIAWYVTSPPPITSAKMNYLPATSNVIELTAPKGATLADPPERLEWEQVTGRLQYIVRIYVKGTTTPVLERIVTSPSVELLPGDRERLTRGTSFVWTVVAQGKDGSTIGAGQSTFRVK